MSNDSLISPLVAIQICHENQSSKDLISEYIEFNLREIRMSLINDITRDELLYLTINKSKEIWTDIHTHRLNDRLEKHYKTYLNDIQANPNDEKRYHLDRHHVTLLLFRN